ncbi:hypothetical protein D9M69_566090 [compost metagenome]
MRQQARDTLVNQARLFVARHHLDGKAQDGLCLAHELVAVLGLAQGLRGDGPDLLFLETVQAFGKAGQAVPATLHGGFTQHLVFVQAVALAHGFLDVFDAFDVAGVETADFEPEAVGAEVDRGEEGSVLHGER